MDRVVLPGGVDDSARWWRYRRRGLFLLSAMMEMSMIQCSGANFQGIQIHTVDQALTFTSGIGKATIAGKDQDVKAGDLVVVPAGTQHQFVNTGPTPLVG